MFRMAGMFRVMSVVRKHPVVVVLGATGAGKSKLALELATKYNGELISADSMQVYQGLDVVTNKVTAEERKCVPHHMMDYVSPLAKNYTVVHFRDAALPTVESIIARGKLPIIVGGTNYYIEALLWKLLIKLGQDGATGSSTASSHSPDGATEQMDTSNVGEDGGDKEGPYRSWGPDELLRELQRVDPDRARRIHPHDRRKIIRALQIQAQHGVPMSELLTKQHEEEGGGAVSGPLRFPSTCVLWVKCDQQVLDERTDKRVDQMIDQGLVKELAQFHQDYNEHRFSDNSTSDYTLGIFQSIGFKEFHAYLTLPEPMRATEGGQRLLQQGVEDMKRATRKYARKQCKWIVNRFLKRRGANVPPVYAVDSTCPDNWQQEVHDKACDIVHAYIQGESPSCQPETCEENFNVPAYNKCEICGLVFVTTQEWQAHIRGRRHAKMLKRKRAVAGHGEESRPPKDRVRAGLGDGPANSPGDGPLLDSPADGPQDRPGDGSLEDSHGVGPLGSPADGPQDRPGDGPLEDSHGDGLVLDNPGDGPLDSPADGPQDRPGDGPLEDGHGDGPLDSPADGPQDCPGDGPLEDSHGVGPLDSHGDAASDGATDAPSGSPRAGPGDGPRDGPGDCPGKGRVHSARDALRGDPGDGPGDDDDPGESLLQTVDNG